MKKTSGAWTGSFVVNILIGVTAGILISILLSILAAIMVNNRILGEEMTDILATSIQFIAVFIGCLIAGKRVRQRYAIICGITAILYCLILLSTTILLLDSRFKGVGLGAAMCAAGYLGACAICMTGKGKGKRRRRK